MAESGCVWCVYVWRSGVRRRRRASKKTLGKNGGSDFFSPRRKKKKADTCCCCPVRVCARCACVRMAGSCVSEQCVVGGGVTDARSTTTASDASTKKSLLRWSRLSHRVGVFRKWRSCGGHKKEKLEASSSFRTFLSTLLAFFSPVLLFFLCEYKLCHVANMAGTRCIFTPLPL